MKKIHCQHFFNARHWVSVYVCVVNPNWTPQNIQPTHPMNQAKSSVCQQVRNYVANEYPTFARIMSMVCQNLTFLRQITLIVGKNRSVLMENIQILGLNIQILEFFSTLLWGVKNSTPYM